MSFNSHLQKSKVKLTSYKRNLSGKVMEGLGSHKLQFWLRNGKRLPRRKKGDM